ncbi:MlaD family protein [Gordonia sp. ABSL1-1]|uniref:MlaD family protein n=1 Tax=Gordonia sp. ABSL1-1 TaxID=3053923 RepID=UPI002572E21E|nr:MlaD family protein [Gordonia sp. ABSL1-1]MDL9938890.1 MlaD family protein [Gordonia sp. ABSL1-1]
MNRVRPTATAAFAAFVVAMLIAGWVIVEALDPSVSGPQHDYTAEFTDVSGLSVGNDVRELGVRVGKVESIELTDGMRAQVRFSVLESSRVYGNTQIAIRYLNLVGQRYLDLVAPATPSAEANTDQVIPTSRTIGSFDITEMFNGLRPLFGTLEPEQLNSLMSNMLAVIEGRGRDVGSVLTQLRDLGGVVADRSALIATVIGQLGRVAAEIRYKSPQLNDLIAKMGDAFGVLAASADKTQTSMRLAARSLGPVRALLGELEGAYYGNFATLDRLLRKWVPGVGSVTSLLGQVPALIDALDHSVRAAGTPKLTCGAGEAIPSATTKVLLAGVPVVVCR